MLAEGNCQGFYQTYQDGTGYDQKAPQSEFQDALPYFWAGFTLHGESASNVASHD